MKNLGWTYFCVALSLLVIGMVEGFWMGATNALQYRNAHVGLLLPGFVTLSLYGVVYRLWRPRGLPKPSSGQQRLACPSSSSDPFHKSLPAVCWSLPPERRWPSLEQA
jgi:hypothetical protein